MKYRIENTNYTNLSLEKAIELGLKQNNQSNKIIPERVDELSVQNYTAIEYVNSDLCSYIKKKLYFIISQSIPSYCKYLDRIVPFFGSYTKNSLNSLLLLSDIIINNFDNLQQLEIKIDKITRNCYNKEYLIPFN